MRRQVGQRQSLETKPISRGTDSSNPAPSSGESHKTDHHDQASNPRFRLWWGQGVYSFVHIDDAAGRPLPRIYDNMKTAVESVFIGKDRQFNRRFLRMCGHYLVEPTACTPASGWEKGQVENQVGVVRERFFTPRLRVASYES